jgi:hypothetical protein
MSKRTIIIAISCVVLIIGIGTYLILKNNGTSTPTPLPTSTNSNPFGATSGNVSLERPTTSTTTPTLFGKNTAQNTLVQITDSPTADGVFVQNKSGANVLFTDRITGNIFSFNALGRFLTRITNTTVPTIYHSYWANNGAAAILQSVDNSNNITTFVTKFVATQTASSSKVSEIGLQGVYLQKNIQAFAVSPSTKKIFYLVPQNGGVDGFIANPDNSRPTKIFNAPITEWAVSWPKEDTVILTTKPSSNVAGYSYALNTKSGSLSEIIGNITGLTVLANSSVTQIAYSNETNNLSILSTKDNSTLTTPVSTLPEKCVWSKKTSNTLYCAVPSFINTASYSYPDAWYQGLVSFTDTIYKINTVTGNTQKISRPFEDFKQNIDAINLSLSANEDYLLFTNKNDYTLWSLGLNK